ncbi:MAG: LysR family transcriptional regulator [Rhodospirillales bacterium]|nr:LysR family transcriptional regulator [Rhodospirillales bacterium]
MEPLDLNLLTALDVLLREASVTAAARRLGLSASAMSRTLARLRAATGDPLLVRAGRGLVPTPHAAALRARVPALAEEVRAVLRPPPERIDLATLERVFTLRANEAFIAFFSVPLLHAVAQAAPHARLHFLAKPDKDATALREGAVDLEIGIAADVAPELRRQGLFHDRLVGVVRTGHPLLAGPGATVERYAACNHVAAAPRGMVSGPVDAGLAAHGLRREVAVVVPGFPDALRIARHSDLVALVPRSCLGHALPGSEAMRPGLEVFDLPVAVPEFAIAALWHPRLDADPAHRWLRGLVRGLCRAAYPPG